MNPSIGAISKWKYSLLLKLWWPKRVQIFFKSRLSKTKWYSFGKKHFRLKEKQSRNKLIFYGNKIKINFCSAIWKMLCSFIYIIKQDSTFVYMFLIAGQTAETNGLTFFEEIYEYPGGKQILNKFWIISFSIFFIIPRATPGASASLFISFDIQPKVCSYDWRHEIQ